MPRDIGRLSCVLGAVLLALAVVSAPVSARTNLAIGQVVYEQLQQAQIKIEEEAFDEALRMLDRILETQRRLNNYERAQIWSMKGNVYYQREQMDQALQAFKTAVAFGDLPAGFLQIAVRTLAQLSFMQDYLQDALDYTQQLIQLTPVPDANNHALLAQIYFRMDNFRASYTEIQRALQLQRNAGMVPPENWLLIVNAIHYNLNEYQQMIAVFEQLIEHYPKDSYVLNLAAIYGQLEQTDRQLLLMEPMYDQGRLHREVELVNLANLMLLHRVPYKGAQIIERGFEQGVIERSQRHWELLAQSWQMAAEDDRSLQALAQAAKLNQRDGITDLRLAQSYMNLYRWQDAEKALEQALQKGALPRVGDVHLLLGMVRFYQKHYLHARRAFQLAENHKETAHLAAQWLTYLDQEIAKEEALR